MTTRTPTLHRIRRCAWLALAVTLAGCEQLGIEDPAKAAAAREADSRAVGAACRHAGRAIEDCYVFNPKAAKAAVFAGWKEMNDYMAENKIEVVRPEIPPKLPKAKTAEGTETAAEDKAAAEAPGEAKRGGAKSAKHG